MKKCFLLAFALPFILFSCNTSSISTPKNPFKDDTYKRVGMKSEYKVKSNFKSGELEAIKTYVNNPDIDETKVSNYEHTQEYRDFKYAYFGKEYSTVSQCSMLSTVENQKRYKNFVTINENNAKQETQTANAGIIKTNTITTVYTFDDKYKDKPDTHSSSYSQTITVIKDEVKEEPTFPVIEQSYDGSKFILTPFATIRKQYFNPDETDFKLLGDNAVYGMTDNNKYLIKEGYSLFSIFSTMMGRTYKAQDNYFYEGLLEKDMENEYHFTYFRFYHELLILSKPIPEKGVPILYLEKPVLIEYREDKYNIEYKDITETYTKDIPIKQ